MINEDFLERIVNLKAQRANVVLECGIQSIIGDKMKMIKRINNLKKIESISRKLHERKISFEVSIIYGLPKQTLETFKRTK